MTNPINNAIKMVRERDLVTCNRCGCHGLAWVKLNGGRSALVTTTTRRPFYRGAGPTPEAAPGMRYAMKFSFHRCEDYLKILAEQQRIGDRANWPHEKADKPWEILADAVNHEVTACGALNFIKQPADSPIMETVLILLNAVSKIERI